MSKKADTARMNYLWMLGEKQRREYQTEWWAGYSDSRFDYDNTGKRTPDSVLKMYELEQTDAWESGYDYYRSVYHG